MGFLCSANIVMKTLIVTSTRAGYIRFFVLALLKSLERVDLVNSLTNPKPGPENIRQTLKINLFALSIFLLFII